MRTRSIARWILALLWPPRPYPRDGFLSLFYGPGYVGHQLFQIVLGGLNFRRLCVHFHLPIRRPPQGKGLARSIQGQSEYSLRTSRRDPFSQDHPGGTEQRSSVVALCATEGSGSRILARTRPWGMSAFPPVIGRSGTSQKIPCPPGSLGPRLLRNCNRLGIEDL
jgi:hypothetical protein